MDDRKYKKTAEVAEALGVEHHLVVYLSDNFKKHVKVVRSRSGHRYYSDDAVEALRRVLELRKQGLVGPAIRAALDGVEYAPVKKKKREVSPARGTDAWWDLKYRTSRRLLEASRRLLRVGKDEFRFIVGNAPKEEMVEALAARSELEKEISEYLRGFLV